MDRALKILLVEDSPDDAMLLEAGITCIQNVGKDIDLVTGKRCTLAAFLLAIEKADAGMTRLVAIVED